MYSHRKRKTGLPPGTLSESTAGKKSSIHMITYTETQVKETFDDMEMLEGAGKLKGTVWINITGIEDSDLIRKIGEIFDIHPLILEDIQNTDQRAKVENHTKYLYLVTKRLIWNASEQITEDEQISFILFKNIILTFQEHEGDTFDTIRSRIREKKGRIRNNGADYLLYALIDSIVDYYFTPLEELQEEVDTTEQKIYHREETTQPRELYRLNSEFNNLRRIIHPMRELFFQLGRHEVPLITRDTHLFLKDIEDHLFILTDFYESLRDKIKNLHDMHVTTLSDRMNNIIRILTVISTIFIPLTFIVGIYGMNFTNMPELRLRWGYFGVLGVLGILVIVMILIFKRKKWI